MRDDDVVQPVRRLGNLRRLDVIMEMQLTVAALETIGLHCPLVEPLRLTGAFAIAHIPINGRPYFPHIRTLMLDEFGRMFDLPLPYKTWELAPNVVSVLCYYAPQLKYCVLDALHSADADENDSTIAYHCV